VFFSAALQGDNHGEGVTEEAPDAGEGYKAGKPIQVVEELEFGHRASMTSFRPKGKTVFTGNDWGFVTSQAGSYPLKNAKSQKGKHVVHR
jgi:hypothetical protein